MSVFAHSHPTDPGEPLFTPFGSGEEACQREVCAKCESLEPYHGHLNKVAWWTAKFTAGMFQPQSVQAKSAWDWGYLTGLWHDLGKFAPEWQAYLCSKSDPHEADVSGKLDHSTAGAQHATKSHWLLGHLLAYPIAGHHAGLADASSDKSCLASRLKKLDLPDYSAAPQEIMDEKVPNLPPFLQRDPFSIAQFTRMLFSSLVDADFLATEAFMNPAQAANRSAVPINILQNISDLVDARIESFRPVSPSDSVYIQRRIVVENCRAAAESPPGLFTLTVPTGGGKTLSSLTFALRHAIKHVKQRIIYVVPFTSIIEQNAEVIRAIAAPLQTSGFTPVIEHHSSLSSDHETGQSRLAAENWDAPIIITTAVQFYESLFAAKTSRTRKLHHIANSVVILDEAQTLPVDFLAPCLRVIQELADHYNTTIVLCTATQPAVQFDSTEFPIGLTNCREIIGDTASLFAALKRVEVEYIGSTTDLTLTSRLRGHPQVLCIVNRRKHAQQIFKMLGTGEGNYHLSALMCPEHRSRILLEIRDRLKRGLHACVISTQLIEAGVDVDFPVVYRAMAGLDSIAQAAGRCNRNGHSPIGHTYIFSPEDQEAESYFRETSQVAHQLIDLHPDLLGQKAIQHYFDLYYYQQSKRWDRKGILDQDSFRLDKVDKSLPFKFQFASVAKDFQLIDDWQIPVIIPFSEHARSLILQLRNPAIPMNRELLRALQRYTVQISPRILHENIRSFEKLRDDQFHALISIDLNYSEHFGITFEGEFSSSSRLII